MWKKLLLSSTLALALSLSLAAPLAAQTENPVTIVDTSSQTADGENKYNSGRYDLNDMVMILVRASQWILGIVGSLALLMFIYGGFMFLISAGSSEKIGKAKTILVAAVVGLAIVFGSYLIIKFVLSTIGFKWNWNGKPIDVKDAPTAVIVSNYLS